MTDDDRTRITFDPRPGVSFAQYRIVDRIGSGGMGEVVLAEDTSLQRMIALKFLPAHAAADPELKERFLREARAAAALNHPNIVHVYEVGEHEGRPFIAMEHVDGPTLRDRMADGPFPLEDALGHGLHLAEALAEAHRAGVIHRDIKPGNIVFDRSGRPKLLDFGLAAMSGAEPITRDGSTLGTVGYMAPETIRGQAADGRSDVFSLGVVLYEMLSGKSPFRQQTEASTLDAVLHRDPEPLSRSRAGMPATLQAVLDKALQKDPTVRHQTAGDLAADLRRERRDSASGSGSVVLPGEAARPGPTRSRRGPLVGAAIAVLLLAGLFWIRPWSGGDAPRAIPEAEAAESRLLILPFENLADPTDADRLGEILASLLTTDLSQSPGLSVVSSQHLHRVLDQLAGDVRAVDEIARRTRADRVLSGRVLRAEPLVITAELVDATSGTVLASSRVQGEPGEDVFALVDRLTPEVRSELSLGAVAETGAVSDFTTHSPEAYAAYIRGRDALDRFYYEDAHEHLQLAVELDPGFAAAWHQLADLYLRGQYRGAAMRARDRAMALLDKVTWRERLQILALDANLREEHTEATSYLQEIVDRDPQDVDALMALATTQRHDLSDIDLSIPNFERVVALDAGYAAAWNQLAYSYVFGGETDKGLAALDRYLELLPGDANPHDSRGDILAFLGRPEEAQSAYEKALEIRPDFQASTGWKSLIMGVYLGETGLEPRMREYIAATESTEISSAAWFRTHLASLPAYHGRFGEAVDRHEEVLRWMERDDLPDWAPIDTRLYLARLLVHLGRYEEAHARLDEAEPMARETEEFDEWWVGDARVEVLLAEGRGSEARAELARMEQLPPDGDFVYARDWTRARIAEADGDDARALRLYEAASPRDWDYQIAVDLGTRRLRLGAVPRAIEILERAATACTEVRIGCPLSNSRVHYFLGQAYEKAGRPADAAAQYRTLLDLWKNGDPDLPERDDAAARLERLEANL